MKIIGQRAAAAAAAAALGLVSTAFAQEPTPAPSPAARRTPAPRMLRETVTAMLNGKKVAIEYGRPALRGRTVQQLLAQLQPDRVWRAGGDQATTLITEGDILIGDKRVPAGKYTLYLYAPETGDYALIVNSDLGVPLKTIFPAAPPELADALWPHLEGYAPIASKEVARIPLKHATPGEASDLFRMSLDPARDGVSALMLTWGDQAWTVEVRAPRVAM